MIPHEYHNSEYSRYQTTTAFRSPLYYSLHVKICLLLHEKLARCWPQGAFNMRLSIPFSLLAAFTVDLFYITRASPTPVYRDPRIVGRGRYDPATLAARAIRREGTQSVALEKRADTKYFHEPGGNDLLGHYDIRYFKELDTYENRQEAQLHMIRAYLEFFQEKGLETWLAHGTLLGWWWNEKVRPSQETLIRETLSLNSLFPTDATVGLGH